ncbi:methyl-accepting chemotaxis protein [Alkalihalobacterium sp. APHAB7]|uniref:methyl-accepting chemotaxis protein n=1 Tax=Alkalihalobacterium sp. APHAB7 TaxID=3402081 RepID=UPI003AAFF327
MFKKIQNKIMVLIAAMLVVTIVTVSYVTYNQTRNVIESSTQHEASNVVNEITRYTNQYFEGFANQLMMFSQDQRMIDYNTAINEEDSETISSMHNAIGESFSAYMKMYESIDASFIGTPTKVMETFPATSLGDDFDPTIRPWYIQAQNNPNEVIWTDPYQSASEDGELIVTGAKAVLDPATGNLLGVIGMNISLDGLTAIVNQVDVNYQGFAALFDANGTALVHPTLTGEDLSENETIRQMLSGDQSGYIHYHFDGLDRFMYYSTVSATGWKVNAVYIIDNMLADLYDIRNKIVMIAFVMLSLSLIVAYFVSRNITNPLKALQSHVRKVAAGDLTVVATTKSRDEVGELTNSFNEMTNIMKALIQSVQSSANEVNNSAESLSAISEESIASSEEVSSAVAEIASGAVKQVDDVEDMKNRTMELSDQIEKVTKETYSMETVSNSTKQVSENGTLKVDTLQEKTVEANEVLHNVENVVTGLYEKITDIEHVMSTINGISEQTNLLALNASIEAARAGEHGKGFAVVANEVRKLAEESSQATVRVSETISGIFTQSEKVKSEINRTKEIFTLQTEAVDDTQAAFKQIVASIEDIVSSLSTIRTEVEVMSDQKDMVIDGIQNIAAVAEEASASVEEVNAASDQQVDALTQVASSAEELNQASSQLLELVKQFKVK